MTFVKKNRGICPGKEQQYLRTRSLSACTFTLHHALKALLLSKLLCLYLLFFSQLFVTPPQTTILPCAFLFLGDGLDQCLLCNVMNLNS